MMIMDDECLYIFIQQLNNREPPNYFTCVAPPSQFSARHFCAVCGFTSTYTCVQCGARYCSVRCQDMHKETR